MAANFEILQPRPGEFRWVLMSQGRVLARSEAYTRRVSCQNAIESFRKAAVAAAVDDQTVVRPVARRARRADTPKTAPAKAARATGRVVGKAAATVAKVVEVPIEAVKKVAGVGDTPARA